MIKTVHQTKVGGGVRCVGGVGWGVGVNGKWGRVFSSHSIDRLAEILWLNFLLLAELHL